MQRKPKLQPSSWLAKWQWMDQPEPMVIMESHCQMMVKVALGLINGPWRILGYVEDSKAILAKFDFISLF